MLNFRPPEISVILVAEHYSQIRKTIRHLLAQTILDRLELVIVAPSHVALAAKNGELQEFPHLQIIEIGPISSLAQARAIGVQKAKAPVAVFAESHCFPEPEWAEALLAAHHQGWNAVGPAVLNANPQTLISWATFFLDFGPWTPPLSAGTIADLPGHNSSYNRELLLQYGRRLATMLEMDSILHWDLRAKGYQLYLQPKAIINHLNISRFPVSVVKTLLTARWFAAGRSRQWSLWKRLLYALGSPLIPFLRLPRTLRHVYRSGHRQLMPSIFPLLVINLMISALGEMIGYLWGYVPGMDSLHDLDLDRTPGLIEKDRFKVTA